MKYQTTLKNLLGFLFLVFTWSSVSSQEQEAPLVRVHYEFYHINDTLNPDKPHEEEMVLYLGRQNTLYGSYASQRMMQQVLNQVNDPGFDGNLTIRSNGKNRPQSYYIHLPTQYIQQIYQHLNQHYLLEETYPEIAWTILPDLKNLAGYSVQKANGHFAGREYTAWFTTELPFQGAPWKLQGLPGLVLEAETKDGEVKFSFAGLETDIQEKALIGIPENAIPTTPQLLQRLLNAYQKNPQAAMSAAASSRQSNVITFSDGSDPLSSIDPSKIKSININTNSAGTSAVTNNPLEKVNP